MRRVRGIGGWVDLEWIEIGSRVVAAVVFVASLGFEVASLLERVSSRLPVFLMHWIVRKLECCVSEYSGDIQL